MVKAKQRSTRSKPAVKEKEVLTFFTALELKTFFDSVVRTLKVKGKNYYFTKDAIYTDAVRHRA